MKITALRPKDEQYLKAILSGSTKDLKAIYSQFFPMVRSIISKGGGSDEDAQDIFQEAIMVIYQKLSKGEFALTSAFSTYLYSVCRFMWSNERRKKRSSEVTLPEDDTLMDDEDIVHDLAERAKRKLFREKFGELSEGCQQVLKLFFDGEKMTRIAEIMGFASVQYAKKRKFKCKEKLVQLIEADLSYKELSHS